MKKTNPSFDGIAKQKTLLLGDVNSGKTRFTFNFLCYLLNKKLCDPPEISILEFGPNRVQDRQRTIGGTLQECFHESNENILSLGRLINAVHWVDKEINKFQPHTTQKILTPRHSARSTQDVLVACCSNFTATQKQLLYFTHNPTKVLIINDVGIYLHLGSLSLLKKALALCKIALLNAYYGQSLLEDYGSYISRREKIMLLLLSRYLDTYLCERFVSSI